MAPSERRGYPPPGCMTPTTWMKFGGAALADGDSVRRACELVAARLEERPAVVVSAHHGVTQLLRAAAQDAAEGSLRGDSLRLKHKALLRQLDLEPELLDAHLRELASVLSLVHSRGALGDAELDYVLSFGERMSARVVAASLRRAGVPATPVDAFDLGLVSCSTHGRARPLPGYAQRVREALEGLTGVPVVTGFLARDERGALTTLGRNGSDLTAALLAEATAARELVFWKSVPGVMSADPRDVPDAFCLERLSFDDARRLALCGADVLHPEALAPARRSGATVRVLDVGAPDAPGTRLDADADARGPVAVASAPDLVRLDVSPSDDGHLAGRIAGLLDLLRGAGVEPRFVGGGDHPQHLRILISPKVGPSPLSCMPGSASSSTSMLLASSHRSGVSSSGGPTGASGTAMIASGWAASAAASASAGSAVLSDEQATTAAKVNKIGGIRSIARQAYRRHVEQIWSRSRIVQHPGGRLSHGANPRTSSLSRTTTAWSRGSRAVCGERDSRSASPWPATTDSRAS